MRALIVEDEYLARDELVWLIQTHSQIDVVATVDDGLAALEFLQREEIDVIFLDINIPSINGMLLAKSLAKQSSPPRIVFVTAYKEFAAEAFELEVFDYILKPYNEQRILNVLHKIEHSLAVNAPAAPEARVSPRTVNLVKGESLIVMPCDRIYYAEADEKVTCVYTESERFIMSMTLSEFIARLPATHFFRCHRSWCVNLDKIREIAPWLNGTYLIKLHDLKVEIPVSRSHARAFRQLMKF
ncbi:MAG: response regulator transcription factor [Paludibacterium sp.]|uniref:LytR/AlgR family response regulator transcription factor n=1 Tax=Paludibacterium sp. TaxID=1917523 RepID=UPI0025D5FD07|nr:LytTR family DNA-binding domain-containing protein [Paludibacterium sp.]MBV8048190.1 response regulator transcription factor [Paludibacterium sp.]MBV8648877.1 response regulator transcription factor [Paludibacterium sp.]